MSKRATPEVIDFVYDPADTDTTDLAANDIVRSPSDYTEVHGDPTTDTNEVLEIEKIELLPPVTAGSPDTIDTWDALRIWDGDSYYPNIRLKPTMLSWDGPNHHLSSPPLGKPVLSGQHNPESDPIGTATPKFGPSTTVTPAVVNDGTPIANKFTVRVHVWRFKGTQQEFSNYIQNSYGTTSFQQNITMSNPYTGKSRTYTRQSPTNLAVGAGTDDPMHRFNYLTGGSNQLLPKVHPWAVEVTNAQPTRANTEYAFTTRNTHVSEEWEALEFDLTNQQQAIIFDKMQVASHANLKEGKVVIEDRDNDPTVVLSDDDRHQLPVMIEDDGTENGPHDAGSLPRSLEDLWRRKQVLWDDGGGFRVIDDGTSIPAGEIVIDVWGHKLELTA